MATHASASGPATAERSSSFYPPAALADTTSSLTTASTSSGGPGPTACSRSSVPSPASTLRDVEIRLSRPATVRGRVTDAAGRPVAKREVRASAADLLENRYYDPTVTTAKDGSYELKFIRPGEQFIQVAPFWLDPRQAPEGTSRTLALTPGESRDGIDFRLPDRVDAD